MSDDVIAQIAAAASVEPRCGVCRGRCEPFGDRRVKCRRCGFVAYTALSKRAYAKLAAAHALREAAR